jgi:hypothetical protein
MHQRGRRFLRIFAVLAILSAGTSPARADEDEAALRVIEEVYRDNRERFHEFTCRFVVTEGTSATLADAQEGRITAPLRRHGLWVVKQHFMRYELDCPPGTSEVGSPPDLVDRGKSVFLSVACLPKVIAWNGQAQIEVSVSRVLRAANLNEQMPSPSILLTPLSLGIMGSGEMDSPAEYIAGSRAGTRFCAYRGVDHAFQPPLEVMETSRELATENRHLRTWRLDLSRGALPIHVIFRDQDGKVKGEAFSLSVREVDNGGFIVEKAVVAWERPAGYAVQLMELVSLDLSPPAEDALEITIEPGMKFGNTNDMRSFLKVTERETLHPKQVDEWLQRTKERSIAYAKEIERHELPLATAQTTAQTPAQTTKPSRWWIFFTTMASIVAIVGVLVLARKRVLRPAKG